MTILAGVAGQFGDQDGSGSNARFRSPNALAVDSIRGLTWVAGSLYATAGNAVVRIAPVH